ncbi:MAG TPA: autotransporter-associated beta strand repeat-containing protein [Planctomycetota bacterium]|nr:autotransporter-associated beta strand repeat-containing protein [Planctomycetota bacterium]
MFIAARHSTGFQAFWKLAALLSLVFSATAFAGQVVWNGSIDAKWSTAANWTPAAVPGAGADVVLTGTGTAPTDQDIAGLSINTLTIDASATTPFTVAGNAITLTANGTALTAASSGHTIATDLVMGTGHTYSVGAGLDLTITGAITAPVVPDMLYYAFDESAGSTANDFSGNSRNGTLQSGMTRVPGIDGNAVQFDGSSGYVQAPAFPIGGGAVSFAVWVNSSNPFANWNRIFDFGNGASATNILLAFTGTSGQMTLHNYNGGTLLGSVTINTVFPSNTWVHVAAVIDGAGNCTIYWNGVAQVTGFTGLPIATSRSNQYIGRSNWPDALFSGRMDDFRIYNRALSQAEVQELVAGNITYLTKTGGGRLILASATPYSGRLTNAAGTLETSSASISGSITNNATLEFNQTSDGVYAGTISGSGTVIKNGNAVLGLAGGNTYTGPTIVNAGTLREMKSSVGLLEGRVGGAFNTTSSNPATSIQTSPRWANVADNGSTYANTGAWVDNSTYIYSGFVNNPTGSNVTYTFAENFDDSVRLIIDGTTVLNNTAWNVPTRGNFTLTPGLHTFELRLGQGSGGVGPSNQSWLSNGIGFGYDTQGRAQDVAANYTIMADPGDGSLFLAGEAGFSRLSAYTVNAGATLDANNQSTVIGSLAGSGSVTLGTGTLGTGANNSSTTFSGVISGSGTFGKQGTGTLTLTGDNTYGKTIVSSGTLQVGNGGLTGTLGTLPVTNNGTLVFNHSAATSFIGGISGSGVLVKEGTGTLSLGGGNTYTGGTVINAGTLRLLDAFVSPPAASIWLDGSDLSTLFTDAAGTTPVSATADPVGMWRDKSGNGRHATQATAANQPTFRTAILNGRSVVRFDGTNDQLNLDLTSVAGQQYTIYVLEGKLGTKANNHFLGTTPANTNQGMHFGYRSDNTYTLAQWANDLNYTNNAITYTGTQVFRTWTNILDTSGHRIQLNGTPVAANTNTTPFTTTTNGRLGNGPNADFYIGDIAELLVYNSALSASAQQAVLTYLQQKWSASVLPFGSVVSIAAGGTLDLNGLNPTIAYLADVNGAGGTVTNNSVVPARVIVNASSGTFTFSGTLADGTAATGLTKNGGFTQILAGANTCTGGININTGTLQVGNGGTTGTLGNGPTVNNASLVFDFSGTVSLAPTISGTGNVTKNGSGDLALTSGSAHSGTTTVNAGTLTLPGAASLSNTASIVLNSGATLFCDKPAGTSCINDTASITLNGGTLLLQASPVVSQFEAVGAIIVNSGNSTISLLPNSGRNAQINASSMTRTSGATLSFLRGMTGGSTFLFAGGIADNTFIPWATVNNGAAVYTAAQGLVNPVPFVTAQNGNWESTTTWIGGTVPTANNDVLIRHNVVLNASTTVRSMAFDTGSPTLSTPNSSTLTVASGLVTCSGAAAPTVGCNLKSDLDWNFAQNSTGIMTVSGAIAAGIYVTGPVGHWTFDEAAGSTANDSSAAGNAGTLQGGATRVAGRVGPGAVAFDGIDGIVNVPGFSWPNGGGPVTVSFWNFVPVLRDSWSFGVGNDGANRFSAHTPWSNGDIYWDYPITGTGRINTAYGAANLNKWTHITLVSTGNAGTFSAIYLDGVLATSAAFSDGPDTALSGLQIGHAAYGNPLDFHLGSIDDFRIYNRVLSPSEITQIFTGDGVGVVKGGSGTLVLSGANSYLGATTVTAGTLRIAHSSALGATAAGTTVQDGAALEVAGNISVGAEAISVSGTGVSNGGVVRNVSGANTLGGSLTLNAASLVKVDAGGDTLTVAGSFGGSGALTKDGPGTLVLNGTSTNAQIITVNAGTLQGTTDSLKVDIVNNGAVVFNQATTGTYPFVISGTGSLGKAGSGTVLLTGVHTYAGATNVNGGTLRTGLLPPSGSVLWLDASDLSTLTKDGSNRVSEWRDKNGTAEKMAQGAVAQQPVLITYGINSLPVIRTAAATQQHLFTNTNFPAPCSVFYVSRQTGGANLRMLTARNNNWLLGYWNGFRQRAFFEGWVNQPNTAADTNAYLYGATIPGAGQASTFYENGVQLASNTGGTQGPNGLSLSGSGEFSNGDFAEILVYNSVLNTASRQAVEAYLNARWFNLNVPNILPDGTDVTVAAGATLDLLMAETIGSLAGAGSVIDGSSLTTGGNGNSSVFSGVISGNGALIKQGAGTMTLSGANTYSGATTVSAGVLQAAHGTALGSTAAGTAVLNGAALEILGDIAIGSEAITVSGSGIAGAGVLRSGSGDNSLDGRVTMAVDSQIAVDAGSLRLNGSVSGSAALTKIGPGALLLAGACDYTGATTIAAGTIRLVNTGALPGDYAAYYSFDNVSGTTVFNGGSLPNKDGTLMNGATITASGYSGNGMALTQGSAQFMGIALSGGKGIDLSGGNWTVSARFRDIHPSSTWRTLTRGNTGDHQVIVETGSTRLGSFDNVGGTNFRASGYDVTPVVSSGWHQVTAVGSGTTTAMYIDGVLVGTVPFKSTSDIYAIGNWQGGGQAFSQVMDEVYIYQRALSAAEIKGLVLPANTQVRIAAGATLDLNGSNQTIGSLTDSGGAGSVVLGGATLTTGNDNLSTAFSGTISGAGNMTKIGTGTFDLTGANNFAGTASVAAGVLQLSSPVALAPVTPVVMSNVAGAVLNINAPVVAIASLAGGGSIGGNVTLGANTLVVGLDNSSTRYDGIISGTGGITKAGTGTLTLSGSHTYSGPTLVNNGTLKVAPVPVAGAGVWLDASDSSTIVKDGSNLVQQWNDKSGNGRNFTATGSQTPLFVNNALNGMSALRLDGVDDRLSLNSVTNPATVFIVNRVATQTSLDGIYGSSNPGDKGIRSHTAATPVEWRHPGDGNDFTNGGSGQIYINGVATNAYALNTANVLSAARGSTFTAAYNNTHLGWYFDLTRVFDGDIAEVLIYETALSTAQRQAVENYLMLKWLNLGQVIVNVIPDASAVTVAAGATLNMINATETIGSLAGAGDVLLGTATLTTGGNGATTLFSGVISGTGGLVKEGAGALSLGGVNTYSGATTLNGGTLLVNGSVAAGAVTTASGTTLGGSGTIGGNVTANGTVAPGSGGIGTLTVSGTMDFAAGSSFTVELDGTGPTSDTLSVGGTVTFGANVALNASLGTASTAGQTFTLINKTSAGSIAGTLNGLPNGSSVAIAPRNFIVRYDLGTGSNDLVLTDGQPPTANAQVLNPSPLEDVTYTITLTGNDPDGDTLTFAIASGPTNGTLGAIVPVNANTATVTYTSNLNYNGADSFTFTVADALSTSAPATVSMTVVAVNDVPVFTAGTDQTVLEDSGAATIAGWATGISAGPTDEAGQTLTFTVTANTNPALFSVQPAVASDGTLTFTPAADENGTATITLQLADNGGTANGGVDTSATQQFVINVTAVNDAPSFTIGADQTVVEDAGAQIVNPFITVISAGPANESTQTVSFLISGNTNPALFSAGPSISSTGVLTYTPAADANGTAIISVQIQDNGGTANGGVDTSAVQQFTITVTAVNDQPVANAQNVTVLEDGSANITLTANDSDPEVAQVLTYAIVLQPQFGTLTNFNAATGAVTYTPNPDYNGPDSFTFNVTDDNLAGAPASLQSTDVTVSITVTAVNDVPSFTASNQTVLEDSGPHTVAGWANAISAGPADEAAQALNFTVSNNNNALFSVQPAVSANGTLTYTLAVNANGVATLSVQISDDGGTANGGVDTSAVQTFTLTVTPVNDRPVANAQTLNTGEDTPVSIFLSGVDSDPEVTQVLSFAIASQPANGTLSNFNPATGQVTYTPNAQFNGTDTFTFTVTDDAAAGATANLVSVAATVTVSVANSNSAPVANAQTLVSGFEKPLVITLSGNDGDPEVVQVLTYTIVTQPANGTLSSINQSTGAVTYTPNAGFTGADSFTFTVTDDATGGPAINLTSAPATVSITVTPAPTFTSTPTVSPDTVIAGQPVIFSAGTSNNSTITWNFGDGTTATGATTIHTFTVPGIYTTIVTATSPEGVSTSVEVTIFVGLGTESGSNGSGALPAGVTGIWVGGAGQQKPQGGSGKLTVNFVNRERTSAAGSAGQIAFPSTMTYATLKGKVGTLTLGKGSLAQSYIFTLDKRGKGRATSLQKMQVDLKKKKILFKVGKRAALTDLAESLGATFDRNTKKGNPIIIYMPATLQVGNDLYIAMTFELLYRQKGSMGKAGLRP